MRMNFSSIKTFQFELLPIGNYLCRVTKVDEVTSSSGNLMWNLRFVVAEGEYEGRSALGRITWTEAAQSFIQQMLTGFVEPLGLDLMNIDVDPLDLMRDECLIVAKITQEKKFSSDEMINTVKATLPMTDSDDLAFK